MSSHGFEGAYVDSGAQKTVIAFNQTMEYYCALVDEKMENGALQGLVYNFGSHHHKGVGRINIRFPISDSFFLSFSADVLDVEVPLLLGIDVMSASRLILEFGVDEMRSKNDGCVLPLERKNGHVYLE